MTIAEYVRQMEWRTMRFANVFGPDAVDAALAACDEAMLGDETPEGVVPERARLYIKELALRKVAKKFAEKADELEEQRWKIT